MTLEDRIRGQRGGLGAYLELTKPGITFFVAVTSAAGYLMASLPAVGFTRLFHLTLGVVLGTAGALALNQYLERGPDSLMIRTRPRPVPSGRVPPNRAALFGWLLLAAGIGHLWFWLGWLPALITGVSAVLYDAVYTPLKLSSPIATPVGAIPGALPVLIGWTAHSTGIDARVPLRERGLVPGEREGARDAHRAHRPFVDIAAPGQVTHPERAGRHHDQLGTRLAIPDDRTRCGEWLGFASRRRLARGALLRSDRRLTGKQQRCGCQPDRGGRPSPNGGCSTRHGRLRRPSFTEKLMQRPSPDQSAGDVPAQVLYISSLGRRIDVAPARA